MLGVVMNSLKGPDVLINQVRLSKLLMNYRSDSENFSSDHDEGWRGFIEVAIIIGPNKAVNLSYRLGA